MHEKEMEIVERLKCLHGQEPQPKEMDKALGRVRAALVEELARQSRVVPRVIRFAAGRWFKYAVAAVLVLGVLAGMHYFGGDISTSAPAYADALDQLYKNKVFSYTEKIEHEGTDLGSCKVTVMEPGLRRDEWAGQVNIRDYVAGREITCDSSNNRAWVKQFVGRKRTNKPYSYLDWITRIDDSSGRYEGRVVKADKQADVYVYGDEYEKITLWLDVKSRLPIVIERETFPNENPELVYPRISLSMTDFDPSVPADSVITFTISASGMGGLTSKYKVTLSDFVWDEPADESVFSMEVPDGYVVAEQQYDMTSTGEKNLLEVLYLWASESDGLFPNDIKDICDDEAAKVVLVSRYDRGGDAEQELNDAVPMMNKMVSGLRFAMENKALGEWYYYGKGVKVGEAGKVVCAWKSQGADLYKVIFGDLSVMEVTSLDEIVTQE